MIEAICDEEDAMQTLYGYLKRVHIRRLSDRQTFVTFMTDEVKFSTCDFVLQYINIEPRQPRFDVEKISNGSLQSEEEDDSVQN